MQTYYRKNEPINVNSGNQQLNTHNHEPKELFINNHVFEYKYLKKLYDHQRHTSREETRVQAKSWIRH